MAITVDGLFLDNGNFGGGGAFGTGSGSGGGSVVNNTTALVGANQPTQQFDISAIASLRPQDKYLGRNLVGDIREVYQTYIGGTPVGRGGKFALDAARQFGTTITEAARGYLVSAGLPIVPTTTTPGNGTTNGTDTGLKDVRDAQEALKKQIEDIQKNLQANNPFKILSDQLAVLFGGAVQNPPLQSQATGYTPVTTSSPIGGAATSNIGLYLVLGVVGVIAYFVYKRFAS